LKDQSQLQNKEKELQKLSDLLIKLEEKSQADSDTVKVAQEHFHAVSAGLSSNEGGEDKTLADQIMSKLTTFLEVFCCFLCYRTKTLFLSVPSGRKFKNFQCQLLGGE